MKNPLLPLVDKLLPRQPSIIETLFGKLKSGMGWDRSRGTVHIPDLSSPYPELGFSAPHGMGNGANNSRRPMDCPMGTVR